MSSTDVTVLLLFVDMIVAAIHRISLNSRVSSHGLV